MRYKFIVSIIFLFTFVIQFICFRSTGSTFFCAETAVKDAASITNIKILTVLIFSCFSYITDIWYW